MTVRPATFDHLKSDKKPLRGHVDVVLDDEPVQALAEAEAALERAIRQSPGKPIPDDEHDRLREAVREAREALEAASVRLTFQSIGRKRYDRLVQAYPPSEQMKAEHKEQFGSEPAYDADEFSVALIAASCISPVMSEDQVRELRDTWNTTEYVALFTKALEVNTQRRVANLGNSFG